MKRQMLGNILVALLVISQVLATETQIFDEISKDNKFGQAVSALVQMSTDTENPDSSIRQIDTLLKSLKAQIQQQQADEKERIDNLAITCQSQIADFNSQIETAEQQLANQKTEESDLEDELRQKETHIASQKSQIEQENADRSEYQDQITQASNIFSTNKANFEEAILACEEAIRLLKEITRSRSTSTVSFVQNGVMFVQLSQKFEKIKSLLEKGAEKSHNAFIQPIIDILMELGSSSKLDIGSVEQIIQLIETLLERLRAGLSEHESQYQQTLSGLNTLISDIDTQVATHTSQTQLDEERVQYIRERLSQLTGLIDIQEQLVIQLKTLLDQKNQSCEFEQTNYVEEEQSRVGQLATIQRLIDYFETQVQSSSSNIRSSAFEN